MNNHELKNQLDSLNHPVDADSLWLKIEAQQNKRKSKNRWPAIVVFLFLIVGMILLYWGKNHSDNLNLPEDLHAEKRTITKINKKYLTIHNQNSKDSKVVLVNQNQDSTSDSGLFMDEIKEEKIQKHITKITDNKILIGITNDKKKENSYLSFKKYGTKTTTNNQIGNIESIPDKKDFIASDVVKNLKYKISEHKDDVNKEQNNTFKPDAEIKNSHIKTNPDFVEKISISETVSGLADLPLIDLRYFAINHTLHEFSLNPIFRQQSNISKNENYAKIFFGMGYDHHSFSNNKSGLHRQNKENSRYSLYTGLGYGRNINHFSIECNVSWTQSETSLNHETRFDSWYFLDNGSLINDWSGFKYELYNQYYRMDLDLNFLYHFYMKDNMSIFPKIGLGYNILSKQKGQYFDSEGTMHQLISAREYKNNTGIYMIFGIGMRTKLSEKFVFEFQILSQNKRSLTANDFNGYTHSISALGTNVGILSSF